MPTTPRRDQLAALAEQAPDGSLFMLNLLEFRDRANYADGRDEDITGAEAYGRYGRAVARMIHDLGGRIVWSGDPNVMIIGEGEPEWDQVVVVEYPSLDAFTAMTTSEEYQEIHVHREAGLEHQLLINCLAPAQPAPLRPPPS